jgi:hypothetical protein
MFGVGVFQVTKRPFRIIVVYYDLILKKVTCNNKKTTTYIYLEMSATSSELAFTPTTLTKNNSSVQVILPNNVFQTRVDELIKWSIISGLIVTLVVLVLLSLMIRETDYIRQNPGAFCVEWFSMSIVTAIPFIGLCILRNGNVSKSTMSTTMEEYAVLVVKFGFIHFLFQTSGIYRCVYQGLEKVSVKTQ